MTSAPAQPDALEHAPRRGASLVPALIRLARPKQWTKSAFVAIGPVYGGLGLEAAPVVALGMLAFALVSSGCYVINDLRDAEADRLHPRKRRRPIASGRVGPRTAMAYAAALWLAAAACLGALPPLGVGLDRLGILASCLLLYAANVTAYSLGLKRVVVLDVLSLAMGFVLRVLGGCVIAGITPSTWLLNCTLFLAMFLAFGKRLGERRTLGVDASGARAVQSVYTDDLLRMAVVVTAVATLLTYAGYVQDQETRFIWHLGDLDGAAGAGINVLWITILPATFAVLRCIVLLERGLFDDPTELATKDRGFQIAAAIFVALTGWLLAQAGPAEDPGAAVPADAGRPATEQDGPQAARSSTDILGCEPGKDAIGRLGRGGAST
ncbi:MAG: UbiA prenyltransferase family protein [Planctomycetota bacterium]